LRIRAANERRTSFSSFVASEVDVSSRFASSSSMILMTREASPSSPKPVVATGGDVLHASNDPTSL